jgi:hypothetical protein
MHTRNIAVFAAACCMTLPVFSATLPATGDAAVAEPGHVNRVTAKRVKGSYALDDGRTLRVSEKGRRLYADLGDGPVRIRHVGDGRFEAVDKDQDMRLDFEGSPFPYGVVLRIGSARVATFHPAEPR